MNPVVQVCDDGAVTMIVSCSVRVHVLTIHAELSIKHQTRRSAERQSRGATPTPDTFNGRDACIEKGNKIKFSLFRHKNHCYNKHAEKEVECGGKKKR